jgi:hypothetical protein
VLYHGLLPITSLCAHVTDHNTHLMDTSYVDQHLFHLHLPIVIQVKMVKSFSQHGLKKISVPVERDGGIKEGKERKSYSILFYSFLKNQFKINVSNQITGYCL